MPPLQDIPKPFGDIVPLEEWETVFRKVMEESPEMNLFDGLSDMSTKILSLGSFKRKSAVLILDQLVPDVADKLITTEQPLLTRVQYFSEGLQHRLSFNAKIECKVIYGGYPALELIVTPPVQRVTNMYVAYPSQERPVYLEIPLAGAPPKVRVYEVSMKQIKAYTPQAKEIIPKPRDIDGVCVWFINGVKTCFRGLVVAGDDDDITVGLDSVPTRVARVFNRYLKKEFREYRKTESKRTTEDRTADSEAAAGNQREKPREENNGGNELMGQPNRRSKIKALIVDDERDIARMLTEILKIIDVETLIAFDGEEALEIFHQEKPNIIFSDIYMPKLNGLMLLNRIKTTNSKLPFILFTGYSNYRLLLSSSKFKPDDFIPKPLSGEKILEVMFRYFPELRHKAKNR